MADREDTTANSRWQPIMVVLRQGGRLECGCGALGVIILSKITPENDHQLEEFQCYCQSCWLSELEEAAKRKEEEA
jgi:DNA-binding IclR family transcriptional regulator